MKELCYVQTVVLGDHIVAIKKNRLSIYSVNRTEYNVAAE